MLLKTVGNLENWRTYPAMSIIMNRLFANLLKAIAYFQHDSLWKKLKIFSHAERTHDVSDHKGVNLKRRKHAPLFSITYPQEKDGNCAVNPTMCMMDRDLLANGETRRFLMRLKIGHEAV
jgi:hypothetical protein